MVAETVEAPEQIESQAVTPAPETAPPETGTQSDDALPEAFEGDLKAIGLSDESDEGTATEQEKAQDQEPKSEIDKAIDEAADAKAERLLAEKEAQKAQEAAEEAKRAEFQKRTEKASQEYVRRVPQVESVLSRVESGELSLDGPLKLQNGKTIPTKDWLVGQFRAMQSTYQDVFHNATRLDMAERVPDSRKDDFKSRPRPTTPEEVNALWEDFVTARDEKAREGYVSKEEAERDSKVNSRKAVAAYIKRLLDDDAAFATLASQRKGPQANGGGTIRVSEPKKVLEDPTASREAREAAFEQQYGFKPS